MITLTLVQRMMLRAICSWKQHHHQLIRLRHQSMMQQAISSTNPHQHRAHPTTAKTTDLQPRKKIQSQQQTKVNKHLPTSKLVSQQATQQLRAVRLRIRPCLTRVPQPQHRVELQRLRLIRIHLKARKQMRPQAQTLMAAYQPWKAQIQRELQVPRPPTTASPLPRQLLPRRMRLLQLEISA